MWVSYDYEFGIDVITNQGLCTPPTVGRFFAIVPLFIWLDIVFHHTAAGAVSPWL